MNKTCYVIAFYLGDRRRKFPAYEADKLCYVRKQIETLDRVKHSLSKIYFVFNVEVGHYDLLNEALKIIPKKIRDAEVEVIVRENVGFSYGAWSDIMDIADHDYYIFNEDDYFFIENEWDGYMVKSFEGKQNCGGFGVMIGVKRGVENNGEHFSHSCFCTSREVIKDIKTNYDGFTYPKNSSYPDNQHNQFLFSHILVKAGYRLYDIREEYGLFFSMTDPEGMETGVKIQKMFNHNEGVHLIVPDIIAFNCGYTWWDSRNGEWMDEERFRWEFPHPNPSHR